jgi:hypothetical protein
MENVVRIVSLHNQPSDRDFWLGKTDVERLVAGERLIRGFYGRDDDSEQRLQRFIAVTQRKRHEDLADLEE